eukprot:CAMPEP_0194320672 /NCGR_PEP_ID=MMETSP0171-20130528/16945_1 /TAXON_ID=218684 /ORGANISM="Corethron pennatum, Strain L29A3" /LENGTH=55 /DNA_ID=CAMNT_0039078261 /DNA_START=149 /DNA_END=316 /DNA_ORIENTATION=+
MKVEATGYGSWRNYLHDQHDQRGMEKMRVRSEDEDASDGKHTGTIAWLDGTYIGF